MQEKASFKHVALSFANVGFCVLLMIGISGDWLWIEGWIFGVWIMTVSLSTTLCPFVDNTFLSPLVRAQTERKHRVITSGVYAFVRHPMYLGAVLMFFGGALLMASAYGTLVGIVITLMLAGRIVGEEHLMLQELEGYAEYKRKVKYRLVPFIW